MNHKERTGQLPEMDIPVVEVCRQVGITEQTFHRWKKQDVGLEIDPDLLFAPMPHIGANGN